MYKHKLVDFVIHFMEEIDKEISEMKLSVNARARIVAEEFLKNVRLAGGAVGARGAGQRHGSVRGLGGGEQSGLLRLSDPPVRRSPCPLAPAWGAEAPRAGSGGGCSSPCRAERPGAGRPPAAGRLVTSAAACWERKQKLWVGASRAGSGGRRDVSSLLRCGRGLSAGFPR